MAKKVPAVQTEMIPFYKTSIQAVRKGEDVFVLFKPLCQALGLDYDSQRHRIDRNEALSSTKVIMTSVGADGKNRDMLFIELDGLALWLGSIETSRIQDTKKRKVLVRYQKEAARVLRNHFFPANQKTNHVHDTQGSVGPAYHDFQPPRTAPGEVEIYSPPATMADLVAFGVQFKEAYTAELAKNMPEILKHAMESGGKRSFMSQWRDKTRAYIAETIAEDLSQNEDQMDDMAESIEQVRDRVVELEKNHKRLAKIISADKGLRAKAKRELEVQMEEINDEIKSLRRIVKPAKKKKATATTKKKRVLN